ncbi:AlpA family transcriptional regulator [Nevskia sp.]|uniref:helix-turn-helix transcriptional regulator n=1 Tax=Nevskia sp. TaxID=1929292 RepID=UPI0025D2BF6F|nr:AlpA family phage regulatory protein [Nevskia sp.]
MDHLLQNRITIIRRRQLESRIAVSRSTIYDWINPRSPRYKPDFPKPISIGGGAAVGWVASEVDQWLADQIAASRRGVA